MRLLGVGDGPRDEAMMGPIVEAALGHRVQVRFRAWKEIRGVGSYERKLTFLMLEAVDEDQDGVVAWADADREGEQRVQALRKARDAAVSTTRPAAIGVPDPHAEAWLLDDAAAVREVLRLESSHRVPNVRKSRYPKDALDALWEASPRSSEKPMELLPILAAAVQLDRCAHAKETGFKAFHDDVRQQFRGGNPR